MAYDHTPLASSTFSSEPRLHSSVTSTARPSCSRYSTCRRMCGCVVMDISALSMRTLAVAASDASKASWTDDTHTHTHTHREREPPASVEGAEKGALEKMQAAGAKPDVHNTARSSARAYDETEQWQAAAVKQGLRLTFDDNVT